MKKEIKEKFPSWCIEDSSKYQLMMSDDIDSLMCYVFQNRVFNRECSFFIDVNYKKCTNYSPGIQKLYSIEGHTNDKNNIIALDFAIDGITKCWDNHIVKISKNDDINSNSANLNIALDISRSNYTKKAIVSSFITMLSYYNIDITKWDKDQLAILSAIDGLYLPFQNPKFASTGKHNLELLDYGFLGDFIKENINYIKEVEQKLNLKNGKIWVNKETRLLETNIKLDELSKMFGCVVELPQNKFKDQFQFESKYIKDNITSKSMIEGRIFNLAMAYKNCGVVSFI